MTDLWIPSGAASFEKAANLPAGSLVLFASQDRKLVDPAPAVRFDLTEEDGEVTPWVFWLKGTPWGEAVALDTATKLTDSNLDDKAVFCVRQTPDLRIDLEMAPLSAAVSGDAREWFSANGMIGFGAFGYRLAAVTGAPYRTRSLLINASSWTVDSTYHQRVTGWISAWQLRIWDGLNRTYGSIQFKAN